MGALRGFMGVDEGWEPWGKSLLGRGRGKMGPRIREDNGRGVCTPIPTFPHQGGRGLQDGRGLLGEGTDVEGGEG